MRFKWGVAVSCCLIFTASVSAQPEPAIAYPKLVYQMDGVSKELELTENQIYLLDELAIKTRLEHRPQYAKLVADDSPDKKTRIEEENGSYYKDWDAGISEILNRDQRNRYRQLSYQYRGFSAFKDADVRKALDLTPKQLSQLDEEIETSNGKLDDIETIGAILPARAYELNREYWKNVEVRYVKFLTAKQYKIWSEMRGKAYEFPRTFVAWG